MRVSMFKAKKRIALDVDNTIADTLAYMSRYMLREHGIDYGKMEFASMSSDELTQRTGLSEAQLREIYVDAWMNGWNEISPLAHADKLQMLASAHDVDIVSSRDHTTAAGLQEWCRFHYPSLSFGLVLPGFDADKSVLSYDIYIDDSPDLAMKISLCDAKCILLVDKPYNRHVGDGPGIFRVGDVNEAISMVLEEDFTPAALRRG